MKRIELPSPKLNEYLNGGLPTGKLVMVMGSPAQGKTAVLAEVIRQAVAQERKVGFLSMDSPGYIVKSLMGGVGGMAVPQPRVSPIALFLQDMAADEYLGRLDFLIESCEVIVADEIGRMAFIKGRGDFPDIGFLPKTIRRLGVLAARLDKLVVCSISINREPMPGLKKRESLIRDSVELRIPFTAHQFVRDLALLKTEDENRIDLLLTNLASGS